MAFNSTQFRTNTTFKVEFPNIPSFSLVPRNFKLYQEAGMHDMAEITFPSFSETFYSVLKTGVPVQISWANEKDQSEWYGYVYSVSVTTQSTLIRPVTVKAIGSGFRLKESGNKIWTNKTASEIVTEIATKFNLTPVVTQSKLRFSQQSLVGHTYWEKVVELANRIGYVTQIIGTELHFHPMDKMIDQFNKSVPILTFYDAEANSLMSYEGQTLDVFKPTIGESLEFGQPVRKEKTISGINPITGKIFTKTSSPDKTGKSLRKNVSGVLFKEFVPNRSADDEAAAIEISKALSELARWSIPAKGSCQGQSRISPYKTVQINGTTNQTDSQWIITEAVHNIFFDGRYIVDFSCVTDGTGALKTSSFRTENGLMVGKRNVEFELATAKTTKTVKKTKPKLKSVSPSVKQTEGGFSKNKTVWIGKK